MLDQYYYTGYITIKFKCGCSVLLRITHEDNAIIGISSEIIPYEYDLCNKHKPSESHINAMYDWNSILNTVLKNEGLENYVELLDQYDIVNLNKNLNSFLKKTKRNK